MHELRRLRRTRESGPQSDRRRGRWAAFTPGTEYQVRLAAIDFVNAGEGSEIFSPGPNPTFTTKPVGPPAITFAQPSAITATSAHFSGTVDPEAPAGNPQAFEVIWRIECTPGCPDMPEIYLPADSEVHPIEVDAKDLLPGTDYEVRLIAQNAGGTYTLKRNFSTRSWPRR